MAGKKRFKSFLRWLPFIIIIAELVLLYAGLISLAQAAILIVILEICLIGIVIAELAAMRLAFRKARRNGATRPQAILIAIDACLPPPLAFVIKQELQVFMVLPELLRKSRREEGFTPISCAGITKKMSLAILAVAGPGCVLSLFVGGPGWLRWVLFGVSIYLALYAIGMWTLYSTYRHLVGAETLRVRHGATIDIALPIRRIANVSHAEGSVATKIVVEEGEPLVVSMFGKTNVDVTFDEPVRVESFGRDPVEVRQVRFFADEPGACVSLVRQYAELTSPRVP